MNKIIIHLKEYYAIYLILFTIIVVCCLLFIKPNKEIKEEITYDTSMFTNLTTEEALTLFEDNKTHVLVIGRKTCGVCIDFLPTLQLAVAKYQFELNYLDLLNMDKNAEEYTKLKEKLDYEYTLDNKTDTFGSFMGTTPMFIIIKNNKMVFGYMGSMADSVVKTRLEQYGVIK